jgi:hypothetical protein
MIGAIPRGDAPPDVTDGHAILNLNEVMDTSGRDRPLDAYFTTAASSWTGYVRRHVMYSVQPQSWAVAWWGGNDIVIDLVHRYLSPMPTHHWSPEEDDRPAWCVMAIGGRILINDRSAREYTGGQRDPVTNLWLELHRNGTTRVADMPAGAVLVRLGQTAPVRERDLVSMVTARMPQIIDLSSLAVT